MSKIYKTIIIGAGVSGLTSAYQLLQKGETNFLILEGRNRVGGRVLTKNTIDFGPAWFQPNHKNLTQLLINLNIEKFNQYNKGKSVLVHNINAPAHYFESNQNEHSSYRISGGSYQLIKKLTDLVSDKIVLNTKVTSIKDGIDFLKIHTGNETYKTDKVIITLPPKLAKTLIYEPKLPSNLSKVMEKTHTWMSNAIKVGINFKTPFWRKQNYSGTIISQISPVTELYDHTDANQINFSLMGFVNENLRSLTIDERKEKILNYLEKHLGKEVRDYTNYEEKDWSIDSYTSSEDLKNSNSTPQYGNPIFNSNYMNGRLLFSGTETSPYFGGYLEGAVISGILSANKILD